MRVLMVILVGVGEYQTVTSMVGGHGFLMQYGAILHDSCRCICLGHQVIILGLNITTSVANCNPEECYLNCSES